jgi:hypothetical protein
MQSEFKAEWSALSVRLPSKVGRSAEFMALAVEHQKASGMEITGTALGQMM